MKGDDGVTKQSNPFLEGPCNYTEWLAQERDTALSERDALWSLLNKAYHCVEQIKPVLREVRKRLPLEHPDRMKLLSCETLIDMTLTKKRQAGKELGRRIEKALEAE